jgi:hypothetical protein
MNRTYMWTVAALAVWIGSALAACVGGSGGQSSAIDDSADASPGAAGDAQAAVETGAPPSMTNDGAPPQIDGAPPENDGAPPPPKPDAAPACTPAMLPSSDGHSADYDCMAAGCHGPGSAVAGLLITVSGTIHSTKSGGAPVAGASVFVTDGAGKDLHLVTAQEGIFWSGVSDGGSVPAGPQGTCAGGRCAAYAAAGAMKTVAVSKCPDGPLPCASPTSGQCAECHTAGTALQQSVHLP